MYICYEHYERFAYQYEYVHFTYSYLAMVYRSHNPGQSKLINKKKRTCYLKEIIISVDHKVRIKEKEKNGQILGSCEKAEKSMEYEGEGDTNCGWSLWNAPQRYGKGTVRIGNQNIRTAALLRSTCILRRVLVEIFCHSQEGKKIIIAAHEN